MNAKRIHTSDSLSWIKSELDGLIDLARLELVSYIEENQDSSRLNKAQEILQQLKSTLESIEISGAAILVRESRNLLGALENGSVQNKQNAYEILLHALLMLPDYLEHVQQRNEESPQALLPTINDLRTVRKSEPLSARVLFFPALDSVDVPAPESSPDPTHVPSASVIAKRVRYTFELGLLGWFRGNDVDLNMQRMQKVFMYLYRTARVESSRRLWWIAGGVIQALSTGGIESSVTVKTLLGKIDRQIKILIDNDEQVFAQQIPDELLKNLLYYLAVSKERGDLVREIRQAYALSGLLPDEAKLKDIRDSISGPNAGLWNTVGKAICEDLAQVKDNLEIFVSDEEKNPEFLEKINCKLHQISDTFAMLGLTEARKKVLEHAEVIQRSVEGEAQISENAVLSIAGTILKLESLIQSFTDSSENVLITEEPASESDGSEYGLSGAQRHKLLDSIISEAQKEIETVKDLLLEYIETPNDSERLSSAPQLLDGVQGALSVAGMEQASELTNSISRYISCVVLEWKKIPDNEELETLAETITSLEYFLEAAKKGSEEASTHLDSGLSSANKLITPVENDITDELSDDAQEPSIPHDEESAESPDQSFTGESSSEVTPGIQEKSFVLDQSTSVSDSLEENNAIESVVTATNAVKDTRENDQQIPVLSGEVDQEILEIFLEEAKEGVESIRQLLPLWQRNSDNLDTLSEMRRTFHTLKGSGRLVGAELIGEFAWAFEDLLNRVMDKTHPISNELGDLLSTAAKILPQLIGQLEGQSAADMDPYSIMDDIRALKQRNSTYPQSAESNRKAI